MGTLSSEKNPPGLFPFDAATLPASSLALTAANAGTMGLQRAPTPGALLEARLAPYAYNLNHFAADGGPGSRATAVLSMAR